MDSSRKRKAPPTATPSSMEGSASKKLKLLNSGPSNNSGADYVQKVGQQLINQLHNAKDKHLRPIATLFLTLPDPDELWEYYDFTKLPIAIDTIENKLKNRRYNTVTEIESDLKRMVQNAKDYNAPKSDVYEDAERIRKLVYNFMKVHNPAYENENYVSFPTPLPVTNTRAGAVDKDIEPDNGEHDHASESKEVGERPKRPAAPKSSEPPARTASASVAPSMGTDRFDDGDFTGKTFQQAQEMIISELIWYTDDEGLEIFTPFITLPPRTLTDYYKFIKHPVSLKSVRKRTRGIHGRSAPTGKTDFHTWDAFEEEVSYIWRNAQDYNEDGSDMFNLAQELQEHFTMRLAEAKEKVEEPPQPRLKLTTKPKVTLNLGARGSPAAAPGVSIDHDALARQKQMIQAGVNGRQTPSESMANGAQSSSLVPATNGAKPQSSTASGSPPTVPGAVKSEKSFGASPALASAVPAPLQPSSHPPNAMLPPPVRPTSGSPYPILQPQSIYIPPPPQITPPTNLRQHPISEALLPNLTIATHPQLKLNRPFKMSIPPHEALTHQSLTITLPSSHYYLQITPEVSKSLALGRPYKMFVSINGTRQVQRDTEMADEGRRKHVYDGTLAPGVNRIEVEVVSTGSEMNGKTAGLEVEKVTVFANLMR